MEAIHCDHTQWLQLVTLYLVTVGALVGQVLRQGLLRVVAVEVAAEGILEEKKGESYYLKK